MGDGERKKDELTVYSLLYPLGVLQFAAGRAGGIIVLNNDYRRIFIAENYQ